MSVLDKTYYYFIGAGGIGMSALARYFKSMEKVVLGYDKTLTELTKKLEEEGIDLHYDDDLTKIPNFLNPENTLVIHTPAVPIYLKEYQYFLQNNFEILKRSAVLGEITANTYGIAVAGTHGKTTTSSILGHILKEAGLESTAFLGGVVENYDSNVIMNGGKITVSEADEFDRSFLRLSPKIGIITSMDADHLDIYGDKETLEETFIEFGSKIEEQLFVRKGLPIANAMTYGVESGADYDAINIKIENGIYHFEVKTPDGELLKNFKLQLPGKHNVENATAAIAVADYMKVPAHKIAYGLENFIGVKRRFNRWDINGKIYIDDYAHHPTELNAVTHSVREMFPGKKVLGVFQPHLFTRTRDFAEGFTESLSQFDELILLDIYPAREEPLEGIHSAWLLEQINLDKKEISTLQDAMGKIKTKEFDVLVTVGAGNIDTLVKPIKQWLYEG
ncbi:UDP-N-acetylmuramate--L-alanine ligase [Moheibacter sediminis]|uniref:UDP-N-acetylmuramate--L-alanine ligase n=1 Tax=Moheibacter sediminis TaxID=1434700 RepID=A0A1W2CRF5_9FLAO|nr:UDP-N-acetylmuramate--L-alanine ligase [Moheibacter sediminis]SMC87789.1 UDP-N-acetylmuramate--L-alanine ligase [Moheibacter sediminis]